MTHDEKVIYQREAAALIMAAMCTGRVPPVAPPQEIGPLTSPHEAERITQNRTRWEADHASTRALMALEAFQLAGALVAESEVWEGPTDQDGETIDPRAMDRECVHGRKMSEACPECDQRAQAAKEGKPAEAASGEGTDTES